jgi:hypothetical protein
MLMINQAREVFERFPAFLLYVLIVSPSPSVPSSSAVVTGSTVATFLISVTAAFKRSPARCEPFHPNAPERTCDLKIQLCLANMVSRTILAHGSLRRTMAQSRHGRSARRAGPKSAPMGWFAWK